MCRKKGVVDGALAERLAQSVTHNEDPNARASEQSGDDRQTDAGAEPEGSSRSSGARSHHGESAIPEPLRRLLEAGLGRLGERPELIKQRLAEMKLPREAWSAILSQMDDRKSGLYRLVAKEVRELLERTNFAEELVKALTTLSFEMKTEVRFIPNDKGTARPNIRSAVKVKQQSDEHSEAKGDGDGSASGEQRQGQRVAESSTTARRATPDEP